MCTHVSIKKNLIEHFALIPDASSVRNSAFITCTTATAVPKGKLSKQTSPVHGFYFTKVFQLAPWRQHQCSELLL